MMTNQKITERSFNLNRLHSISVLVIIVLILVVKPAGAIVI
jgi:hypothetical protein